MAVAVGSNLQPWVCASTDPGTLSIPLRTSRRRETGAGGQHNTYRSALTAHPGKSSGRPCNEPELAATVYRRRARTFVLPVPRVPVHPHAEQIGFFQDIEEVRTVVMGYFERYNQHWLGKERLPKPRRNTAQLDGRNDHNARGRITPPCVREAGCGTRLSIDFCRAIQRESCHKGRCRDQSATFYRLPLGQPAGAH
jgi:hypothetical protein